jgi:hypothetical protein
VHVVESPALSAGPSPAASGSSSVLPSVVPAVVTSVVPSGAVDPVGAPVRDLVAIFDGAAEALRFPDVDAAVLHGAIDGVESAHAEVRRLEAALDDARRRLEDAQDALVARAQRGLAYARIYAEGDPALHACLERIALPRARAARPAVTAPEAPRRRRRSTAPESLFAAAGSEDVVDDDARAAQ